MISLISCGPSAEELKALEQARLDSIAKVEADSLAAVAEQIRFDSIAKVEADSLAAVAEQARLDSIANAKKPGGKKNTKEGPTTGKDGRK